MTDIRDKLLKNSKTKYTQILEDSICFNDREMTPTPVPMLNVALSGSVDGGLSAGVLQIAGPSKNFKSGFTMLIAGAYLRKYPDAYMLFYDSEFGIPDNYFKMFGINKARVIHSPIMNVEELKHDVVSQLDGIERGDKIIMVMDSIGNLASKKEVDDALEGKFVADMRRAKALKSLFRMITPYFGIKDIPLIAVNHTYKEIGMFPKDIVGGGTGSYYSSGDLWIVGRRQDKDGTELTGYDFIINVEKSRCLKEKSRIPITVSFDKGIQKWAGLFDVGLELGFITSPSKGWYEYKGNKCRRSEIEYSDDFWKEALDDEFKAAITKKFRLSEEDMLNKREEELEKEEI